MITIGLVIKMTIRKLVDTVEVSLIKLITLGMEWDRGYRIYLIGK